MRDDSLRKLSACFFSRMALVAYIRAPSMLPCSIAFLIFLRCVFSFFSHFFELRTSCFAVNLSWNSVCCIFAGLDCVSP